MKRLPIGIQTFRKLIENEYLYVDKTKTIYELLISGGGYYFLSRPRRFGKSLLISTLKEIFRGNQELFRGLWIYDQLNWEKHPVIHVDFSGITHSEGRENFKKNINYALDKIATEYNLVLDNQDNKEKFEELARKLYQNYGPVVILIDEYDKPIVDYIEDFQKAQENKEVLAGFYEVIKNIDDYTKFVFITGVSKFSKVSIFSKLNNLDDLTLQETFNTLTGYTQRELEVYFQEHIEFLCQKTESTKEQTLQKIKEWYNGYSWFDGKTTVYNPFGILNLFKTREFRNYWFSTATPTFLIKLIKEQKFLVEDFEGYAVGETSFESFDLEQLHPAILLFQTGYLTIKKAAERLYQLGYPNFEVKESFLIHLTAEFSRVPAIEIAPRYFKMLDYLKKEAFSKLETALTALFAKIPYQLHLEHEKYYHSLCYLILALLGAEIDLEDNTDKGRIDAVLELEDLIYIIEFKLDQATEAMAQIKSKRYYEKYLDDARKIILLGVGGFREKEIQVLSEEFNFRT